MTDYVVCQKKRNSPRLSIKVCIEKCPDKETCDQYRAIFKKNPAGGESKDALYNLSGTASIQTA